jgi:tol-pal system protein YbgF
MLGLLSMFSFSLSAPIVVESRSTELKDRFREVVGDDQARTEQVVDTSPIEIEPIVIEGAPSSLSPIDLTYQMQVLQQEVMSLRGRVEQLSHDIQKSKSIQEDRYLELDRRLQNQSASHQPATAGANIGAVSGDIASAPDAQPATTVDELKSEQSYYDEGLTSIRARDYDQAIALLRSVIEHYPTGVYAPNAYYWIGEVHAAKPEPDYEAARQALVQVIKSYPSSNKVPDAAFKLGKVYHLMGDCQRAKVSLSDVAKTYSTKSAGKLAERYLLDQIDC